MTATGKKGVNEAMDWLMEHQDDPDIDDEIPDQSDGGLNSSLPTSCVFIQKWTKKW